MTNISDIFLPLQAKNDFREWVCHRLYLKRRERCKYCVELVRKDSSFCKESSSFLISTDNTGRFTLPMLLASDPEETFNVHISVGQRLWPQIVVRFLWIWNNKTFIQLPTYEDSCHIGRDAVCIGKSIWSYHN
jgi:hypothetical protein